MVSKSSEFLSFIFGINLTSSFNVCGTVVKGLPRNFFLFDVA